MLREYENIDFANLSKTPDAYKNSEELKITPINQNINENNSRQLIIQSSYQK